MKKILSLALTLTLCLGLSIPALAANQPGDTAITDAKGNTHTLSNPILYTVSPSEVQKIDKSSLEMYIEDEPFSGNISEYLNEHYWPTLGTVYAVPENTVVTLSPNVLTATVFDLDLTWKNGVGYADEFAVILYPGFSSVTLNGSGYILTVDLESSVGGNNTPDNSDGSGGSSGSVGKVPDNRISFYVPKNGETANPFAANTPTNPTIPSNPTTPSKTAFTDVAASAYYSDAVAWGIEKGITSGTSATTFSPDETCTTAQILTFLWRAKGSPEPTSKTNPFTDVKANDYFYKAALWAKENNIVPQTDTTFNGNTPCTRSMAVLYIWRSAGFPAAEQPSNFADVAATTLYAPAVDWAVEKGVTSGTSNTTFSPETTCTRGQIVTFLYRAFAK